MLLLRAGVLAVFLSVVAPGIARRRSPWLERRVLNIAHQGGEDKNPSNTLYAFRRAVRHGADMLELDVGVSRDGEVVVLHDTTLERTTDGSGTVASRTPAPAAAARRGVLVRRRSEALRPGPEGDRLPVPRRGHRRASPAARL